MHATVPPCLLCQPDEGWTDYGRRCLLYVLQHDATFTLDDAGLEAAADYAGIASGAPMSDIARQRIVERQRMLRALLAGRRADALAFQAAQAQPAGAPAAQAAPPAAPDASQGNGGSRVPLTPPPAPRSPSTGLQAPRVAVPAGMPAPRPVQPAPAARPAVVAPVFSADLF